MVLEVNLLSFIKDSLLIMISWLFLALSFHSWGGFFAKLVKIKIDGIKGNLSNIWLGWVFGVLFFAFYNLFLPINAFASCLFYFPGIIYFFIKYWKKLFKINLSFEKVKFVAILLTLFMAAAVSIQLPMNYDTGLYHFNSIRWVNEHHIIKGLGNLHSRLGFNQLYFLYAASLNFHPYLNDYAYHSANSFLYALFLISMIIGGTAIDLILLCLFFFIPMPYFWINNPCPDLASTLLQMVAFRFFIEVVYYGNEKYKWQYIGLSAILSTAMVSIKLSNAAFAMGLAVVAVIFLRKSVLGDAEKRIIKGVCVFITLYVFVWILRGYIQTGYPLFPSSIGRINFDWTVPSELTIRTEKDVYVYARIRCYDYDSPMLKDWSWLDPWFKESFFCYKDCITDDWAMNLYTIVLLIFFPMIMIYWGAGSLTLFVFCPFLFLVWVYAAVTQKEIWSKSIWLFVLLVFEILSILFWCYTAPDPRFANAIFIILFVTCLMMIKKAYPSLKAGAKLKKCLLFYSFVMFVLCFWNDYSSGEFMINGMYVLNKIPMKTFVTQSGLSLLVPVVDNQCWDSALPSTPEPDKDLALRGSTIDEGFCIKKIQNR